MAQLVERRIGSAEVTGPTPVSSLLKGKALELRFQGFFSNNIRKNKRVGLL